MIPGTPPRTPTNAIEHRVNLKMPFRTHFGLLRCRIDCVFSAGKLVNRSPPPCDLKSSSRAELLLPLEAHTVSL